MLFDLLIERESNLQAKKGLIAKMFYCQKGNSRRRKHHLPKYTRGELYEWLMNQSLFHILYYIWDETGRQKDMIPSCDRIDNNKGYSLDNIILTVWDDNNRKGYAAHPTGADNKLSRAIVKTDINGAVIEEYSSMKEAHEVTGISMASLSSYCNTVDSQWSFKVIQDPTTLEAKSKLLFLSRIYSNQRSNSTRSNSPLPSYSKGDFIEWALSQNKFHEMMSAWIASGRQRELRPCCYKDEADRGFTLENMFITTYADGMARGFRGNRAGAENNRPRPVTVTLLDGTTKIYASMGEAHRDTGINKGHISRCCKGLLKLAGGIKWEYFKE